MALREGLPLPRDYLRVPAQPYLSSLYHDDKENGLQSHHSVLLWAFAPSSFPLRCLMGWSWRDGKGGIIMVDQGCTMLNGSTLFPISVQTSYLNGPKHRQKPAFSTSSRLRPNSPIAIRIRRQRARAGDPDFCAAKIAIRRNKTS